MAERQGFNNAEVFSNADFQSAAHRQLADVGSGSTPAGLGALRYSRLTYTQWHNTALCSPTRSTFLTGRNHHLNGCSCITEASNGFPGWSGRIPPQCATIARVLQDNGFSTFWLGKNHNVPEQEVASGANRKRSGG
jgi:arylsulfatase